MTISFHHLLDDCLLALGDTAGSTWSRTNAIWPWCIEAMLSFPILRPALDDHTVTFSPLTTLRMPEDFREVISVEYPIDQSPPVYLKRKNRFDAGFWDSEDNYDVDHDFTADSGRSSVALLYFSTTIPVNAHIKTEYLANHDTDLEDDELHFLTIPDEYEEIIIAYVVCKAYRERLSYYLQDPTAHEAVISEMTNLVKNAEARYQEMVSTAQQKLAVSRLAGDKKVDKFDRVY